MSVLPVLPQVEVIRSLLSHNPHERPSAKELLQSPLLPLKMEDEQLEEVLMRTLQVCMWSANNYRGTSYKCVWSAIYTYPLSPPVH